MMGWSSLGITTYRYTLYCSLKFQQLASTERRLELVVLVDKLTSFLALGPPSNPVFKPIMWHRCGFQEEGSALSFELSALVTLFNRTEGASWVHQTSLPIVQEWHVP